MINSVLCPGIEKGITTMKKSEISIFGINYRYAFGSKGIKWFLILKVKCIVFV